MTKAGGRGLRDEHLNPAGANLPLPLLPYCPLEPGRRGRRGRGAGEVMKGKKTGIVFLSCWAESCELETLCRIVRE